MKYYSGLKQNAYEKWPKGPSGLIEIPYKLYNYDSVDRVRIKRLSYQSIF